jgi:Flp pilus assembly pilin Flp
MRLKISEFYADESGTAALEFALIAAGLCVALITLSSHNGDELKLFVDRVQELLSSFNMRLMS